MSGSPQITLSSHPVLLTKTRHTFHHSFYHQTLVLACQRLVLVTGKRFIDDYFSSSSSLTKLTLSCSYVKSMVNGGDLFIEQCFFLVSTSVPFVLISVALTEFCAEFECFSQHLTDMLLILRQIRLLSSLYLTALCITVSRDREQSAALARADNRSAPRSPNE